MINKAIKSPSSPCDYWLSELFFFSTVLRPANDRRERKEKKKNQLNSLVSKGFQQNRTGSASTWCFQQAIGTFACVNEIKFVAAR